MLESYITPLLMGYVNKYIKNLKPSDLSLSVWGGDVVLQNLELNLEVLQQELHLPVKFLSGRIHELQIHVPWTRIIYDPVTITINTIEFVVKLRDPDEVNPAKGNNDDDKAKAKVFKREMQKAKIAREAEHLPPGYVQGVLNKVMNNISVSVNNLILKYVEDDIVFSLNVKSVSLFSVNEDWEKAFVELSLPSLCLRKICVISDLTICLDSRNADGKIEMYQDPILYKCNLSCRILSKYKGLGSVSAYENQVNVYCENLDLSSTDVQLPMLIRLLKLCIGLYYRTLDLPGCDYKHHPAEEILEEREHLTSAANSLKTDEANVAFDDSSWASWAWSMIPNLAEGGTSSNTEVHYDLETISVFGVFITQCSLTLKVTDDAHDSSIVGSRRFEFSPVLNIEMAGCALEVLSKGEEYFDCQLGVCNIVGYMIGGCLCKKGKSNIYSNTSDVSIDLDELDKENEDELFFQIGNPKETTENGVGFLEDSLFKQPAIDKNFEDNESKVYVKTTLPEKGKQFNEGKVTKKFGAFFFDYFYLLELPKIEDVNTEHREEKAVHDSSIGSVKETSTKRIIIGPCNGYLTTKLHHMILKVTEFCADDTPPRKTKDGIFIDQFVINQLKMGNLPTRGLHLTCHSLNLTICYSDHIFASETVNEHCNVNGVLIQTDRVDYKASSPMYPAELNFLLETELKPKAMFYRAAYSDYFAKFFGVQVGVCQHGSEYTEPTVLNVIPLTHASVYSKVFIGKRTTEDISKLELRIKTPELTVNMTKAQLLMLIDLSKSWTQKCMTAFNQALIDDIFHPKAEKESSPSILELSLIGFELKFVSTDMVYAAQGSLGSIKVSLQSLCKGIFEHTALMYGPLNTSRTSNISLFLDESCSVIRDLPNVNLLTFKVQLPVTEDQDHEGTPLMTLDLKGIAVNITQSLLNWIEYKPSFLPRKRPRAIEKRPSRIFSRSMSASTPKKKSYSRRLLGKSPSKTSKDRNTSDKKFEQRQKTADIKGSKRKRVSYILAVLKSLLLKVDLETIAIFFPVGSLKNGFKSSTLDYNIPFVFKTACMNDPENFPETLVVTLPNIKISSSNVKEVEISSDVPVKQKLSSSSASSLPWALNGEGFAMYILSAETVRIVSDCKDCYIWHPAPWTMFLAAAHTNPKTPDDPNPKSPFIFLQDSLTMVGVKPLVNRSSFSSEDSNGHINPSLGFCIHVDLTSVAIGLSRKKTEVILTLIAQIMKTVNDLSNAKTCDPIGKVVQDRTNLNDRNATHIVSRDADHRSVSTASTADQIDALSISTELSYSSCPPSLELSENISVSLWLQWIIPKMSVTLYGEPSVDITRPRYKISLLLEDLSFAFDYQNDEIQMTTKIGSICAKNYFQSLGSNEWVLDRFDGILLASQDIIGNRIEALPSTWKSIPGSFLTMTYARRSLTDVTMTTRTSSIRTEAVVPVRDQDGDETTVHANDRSSRIIINYQNAFHHKIHATFQSVDVLMSMKPILSIIESFAALDPFFSRTPSLKQPNIAPACDETTNEYIFQPLPQIDLESKGIRVFIPLNESVLEPKIPKVVSSIGNENMVIFQVRSVIVKPDPVNRISSTVLSKDWYRHLRKNQREKGRRTKTWHVQYQLDLNGMSFLSGKWNDLKIGQLSVEEDLGLNADGQNPALEWNYKIPPERDSIKLSPILNEFSCRSIASPAIKIANKDNGQTLDLCTTSMEIIFPKEIIAYGNPDQINLLLAITAQISKAVQDVESREYRNDTDLRFQAARSPDVQDSGVSSINSMKETSAVKVMHCQEGLNAGQSSKDESQSAFEVFLSLNKFSLALHLPENISESILKGTTAYKPIAYFELVQPTLNVSLIGVHQSVQLAVHDIFVTFARKEKSVQVLPEKSAFEDVFLITTKGKRNKTTGLFPSVLAMKLFKETSFDVKISIDRPMQINFLLGMDQVLHAFFKDLQFNSQSLQKNEPDVKIPRLNENKPNVSTMNANIDIQTSRLLITLATIESSQKLLTSLRSMNALLVLKAGYKDRKACSFKSEVDGFEVNFFHRNKQFGFLSPCIFDFKGEADLLNCENEGQSSISRLILSIKSGLVRFQVSQLHLDCLKELAASLQNIALQTEKIALEDTAFRDKDPYLQPSAIGCFAEYSKDDLRTGSFEYVTHPGAEASHPIPNQIVFSEENAERPPAMTWRYPEPRFLTEVFILPLPFHVDEMLIEDDLAEIPCVIRYWDHLEQNYITYRHFFLSQNKSETLSLPDPLLETSEVCQIASEEWQIVVDVAIESEASEKSGCDEIPEDILNEVAATYKTPVSATSLAACIKVDSCYLPKKIPNLLLSASIGCFQVVLSNHFDPTEFGTSRVFSPFFLDSFTYPSNQDACCLEITSLLYKGSFANGEYQAQKMELEFDASLDVMNYHDLSWRRCLTLSSFLAETAFRTQARTENNSVDLTKSKLEVQVKSLDIIASQIVVHTLSLTAENWSKAERKSLGVPIMNHYIICNETEDVIRFGQVDTDEDIVLASGQMYPYSWRSPQNQALHICVDTVGDWKWSTPFDIDSNKGCSRSIKHSTHSSLIHVEIKKVGGIQKQIIFRGGIAFRNCLKRDVEFEMILHHVELVGHLKQQKISQVSRKFLVPGETTRPSMAFSPSTVTSVYVRLPTEQPDSHWSTPLVLALENEQDLRIPLTLSKKDQSINVWYCVSRIVNDQYDQFEVCICPMFIIRNHLSWPVIMNTKSRDQKLALQLHTLAKGKETEVFGLSSNTWYNVNFQLEGTNECTDPPIPINTTFVEILKKKKKLDLLNVSYEAEWPYGNDCSIMEEQPPRILPQRSPTPVSDAPTPDLKCQLLQRWISLPTIVVEIRPKFILANYSKEDLVVRDAETHLVWEFEKDGVLTSPAIQRSIQFGKLFFNRDSSETQWSSAIRLFDRLDESSSSAHDSFKAEELPPFSSASFTILHPCGNICLQFAISSKIRNDIVIINIFDRFSIHNFCGMPLKCFPSLCEGELQTVFYSDAVEIPASADPLNVNRVSLVRQDDPESEIAGIQMSLFSIRFYFMDSEALAAASLSKDQAFDLSRDHLRENVLLRGSSRQPLCIALTSYLKDGIINIYIDKESCPSFDFTNDTQMKFSITTCISGDENDTKNRQMNPSLDWDSWFDLDPRENFCYQCKAFRDSFPKIGSNVAGHLKIITRNSDGEIAPVNEFTLKEINGKFEFTIENQNIAISYQKSANCYYVLFTDDTKETSSVIRPLNIPITNAGIGRINVTVIDDESCEEVFDITIDNLIMKHNITTRKMDIRESRFSIDLGSLQIDNQSTDDYDHFPVVLLPLREVSQRYRGESPHDAPFSDTHANLSSALLRTVFIVHTNGHRSFIDDLTVHAEPLEIYSEDSFIYRLVGLINSFTPPLDSGPVSRKDIRLNDLRIVGQQILNPLNTGNIGVEDLRILLSIHASVKMYLAADHMPIVLGKFNCPPTRTLSKEIVRRIMYHYATQALVRAGLMLGSLEILASPTGLFRSLGKGISDFFALPYDGLTRGPSAFVSGISSGMGSFVRHTSVGALTSITNFASSLSRNMDRLSLDEEHMIRQEQHRCRTSLQVWPGFSNAVSGFGISLLGAVAGLVDHPISNIQKAENTGDAIKGAAKGLGKGLVGMVAKPIGGAMELLSQTGQGILLGTGLTMPPKKLKVALEKPEIVKLNRESDLKYSWKVLRVEFEEYDSLFVTTDVHISSGSNRHDYDGAIILTSGAFYLFDSVSNNISLAFACNEIDLRLDKDNPHVLYIEKRDKSSSMSYNGNELASPDSIQRENSNDSSRDSSRSTPTNFTFPFLLQMSPRHASLLYSQFEYQKDIFEERMADDLEVLDIAVY